MGTFSFRKGTKVDITYLGGLGENLTGSSKLLTLNIGRSVYNILIDVGSRQGGPDQDIFNTNIPVKLEEINAIILTHAHMDHIGKISHYVKNGYKGPIYTTPITKPLIFEALKDEIKIFQRILEEKKEVLTKLKKAFNIVKKYNATAYEGGVKMKKLGAEKIENIKKRHASSVNMLKRNSISAVTDIKNMESEIQNMEDTRSQSEQELWQVLALIKPYKYNQAISIIPKIAQATFYNAGHIEGSAQVDIEISQKNLLFSGDLGRMNDNLIVGKPMIPQKKKYSFISLESTYAGKVHPERTSARENLFNEIANSHGPIIMPCFSLQRIPEVVYTLLQATNKLSESEESIYSARASKKDKNILHKDRETDTDDSNLRIEKSKNSIRTIDIIYVDSPLGKKYKEIFLKELGNKYKYLNTNRVKFISAADRQEILGKIKKGYRVLILSSSGMLQGGTVMHYLPEILKQEKAKIIFTGFPGKNTLASQIVDHNKKIIIKGVVHDVHCSSVYVEGFSSHADHNELTNYYHKIPKARGSKVVLEHGGVTREILAQDIKTKSTEVIIPQEGDKIRIL